MFLLFFACILYIREAPEDLLESDSDDEELHQKRQNVSEEKHLNLGFGGRIRRKYCLSFSRFYLWAISYAMYALCVFLYFYQCYLF